MFAEAVLGRGVAAELKAEDHFGRWEDAKIPILPTNIKPVASRDRAKGMDLSAADFAASLAELRAGKLDDISHIDKILDKVSKGDTFRDMGGLAQAISLADKLAAISGEGATGAGERAVQLQSKMLDTFVDVLNSDVGKAAVAEFMLPGSGAVLLGNGSGKRQGAKSEPGDHETPATDTAAGKAGDSTPEKPVDAKSK